MQGTEGIETPYGQVGDITLIDGELGYLGLQDQGGYFVVDAVVIGGEVYESIEGDASWLTEIDGEPAYVKSTSNGEAVFYQEEQYGAEYTSRRGGSIGPIFELNSKLGFVATVAENKMEKPDREEEQVLWYDGDEVGRHRAIDLASPTLGKSYATYVDGKISYRFRDEQPSDPDTDLTSGVMYGGEELASERNPSRVYDINGKPTYSIDTTAGEGKKIVYGSQETTSYEDIVTFVDVNGTLYFQAESGGEKKIFREQ